MDETWRTCIGWEGWLEVSSLGRVRTVDRLATSKRELQPTQLRKGKLLSPCVANGYRQISTKKDGRRQKQFVHILVARAFVTGWFPGATVDHLDADRQNNRPSNLEWVTRVENTRRQNEAGRGAGRGEKHVNAKLMDSDVPKLLAMRESGHTMAETANAFGVSQTLVYKIEKGKRAVCR